MSECNVFLLNLVEDTMTRCAFWRKENSSVSEEELKTVNPEMITRALEQELQGKFIPLANGFEIPEGIFKDEFKFYLFSKHQKVYLALVPKTFKKIDNPFLNDKNEHKYYHSSVEDL